MRDDRLARQSRTTRAAEISLNGPIVYPDLKLFLDASHAKARTTPGKRSVLVLLFLTIFLADCFRNHLPSFFFP